MRKICFPLLTLTVFCILAGIYLLDSSRINTVQKLVPVSPQKTEDYMLSSLNVTAISQDKRKLIWIGTSAGINVFNGKGYIQFSHNVSDTTALPDDYINVLHRDPKGRMWVGTQNGLARYEGGYRFHRIPLPDTNENITHIESVNDNLIVSNGKRWFKISGDQVQACDPPISSTATPATLSDYIQEICQVLGRNDIHEIDNILRKPKELISTLYKDAGGNLWIGYRNAGYEALSKNSATYTLANRNELAKATKGMDITCLATSGQLILAGTTLRLLVYDTQTKKLTETFYRDIFKQPAFRKQELGYLTTLPGNQVCLVGNHEIVSAQVDRAQLHIGKRASNLPLLGSGTRVGSDIYASCEAPYIIKYRYGATDADSIAFKNKWYDEETQLTTLHNGDILLFMRDMHVALLSTQTGSVRELNPKGIGNPQNIDPAFARQDSKGNIWLGTKRSGLYRFDLSKNEVERTNFVNDVHIQGLQEDKKGQIWITTLKDATCFQPSTGAVLMNTLVSSSQNEWNRQYFDNAISQAPNGDIILGSSDGSIFLPITSGDKDLMANTTIKDGKEATYDNPTSLEKGLCVYGMDIKTTGGKSLALNDYEAQENLAAREGKQEVPHYTFAHDENDLTFRFFYPNFSRRSSLLFQYMLEGYDKEWSAPTYEHLANFANLSPGNYTFRIRLVSSPDLPPLAERSVRITIRPAFWASSAAWLLYVTLLGLLIYYINTLYLRIRSNRMLLKLEQRTNKMNMSFFANISHEFRNPITIIAGPLLALKSNTTLPRQVQDTLNRVCISVNRMLRLIDQMLDFNQLETDDLRLKVSEVDAAQGLRNICAAFEESTKVRGIRFVTEFPEEMKVWIDSDKFEKILSNLFTNALKHTPEQGLIKITVQTEDSISVSVFNNGPLIEEEKLQDVFKRYYQLDDTQTDHHYGWGTGIGLYYVKRLVGLHHGEIQVRNIIAPDPDDSPSTGSGVEFRFRLPIYKEQYTEQELSSEKSGVMQIPIENMPAPHQEEEKQEEAGDKKKKILVVDDDIDVAQYIRSLFAQDYTVENRYSAEEALEDMESISPDIILSDIIMGKMSGYDFCKTLKEDLMFSHIPVVLITAKSNIDEQIAGLRLGAVAYVTKPFDPSYLKAMVESQLHNIQTLRQRLGESTETETLTESVADTLSEQDRNFMDELYKLMERRAAEMELNVTTVCHDLLISQSKFTYKLKELTGDTPGAFFRKYKLNRAAQLLKEGDHSVSEIATMTGFSTAAHFSVAFKKQFGMSPSEYH